MGGLDLDQGNRKEPVRSIVSLPKEFFNEFSALFTSRNFFHKCYNSNQTKAKPTRIEAASVGGLFPMLTLKKSVLWHQHEQ
jgi:hypothetical protein